MALPTGDVTSNPTDAQLYEVDQGDLYLTTLGQNITAGNPANGVTLTLTSVTTDLPDNGVLLVDDGSGNYELIRYEGKNTGANTVTVHGTDGRGFGGTSGITASTGDSVKLVVASYYHDLLAAYIQTLMTEHDAAGAHTTDVIAELTPAAGVTVDSVLLKDGQVSLSNAANASGEALRWDESMHYYLSQARPFNSKGNSFATVQAAIDDLAGDGWVFVPAGTWSENLHITDSNVVLFGAGWASIIDGATSDHAIHASGANVVIRDLQCKTTAGGGQAYNGLYTSSAKARIENVYVSQSDNVGMAIYGAGAIVSHCWIDNSDVEAMFIVGRSRVVDSIITNAATVGVNVWDGADNSQILGNYIDTTGNDGIGVHTDADNCVIVGNRITNWTNEAIDDNSGTSTVASNDTT